jgi:hypothetical protein
MGIIYLQATKDKLQQTIKHVYANENNDQFIEASIGSPLYKTDLAWHGIHLFSKDHVRCRNPAEM